MNFSILFQYFSNKSNYLKGISALIQYEIFLLMTCWYITHQNYQQKSLYDKSQKKHWHVPIIILLYRDRPSRLCEMSSGVTKCVIDPLKWFVTVQNGRLVRTERQWCLRSGNGMQPSGPFERVILQTIPIGFITSSRKCYEKPDF